MTDIKTVGVVGCGLMGSGIAQVCAEAGHTVIEAAKTMGMETKRARLIARENNINFLGPP